MNLLNEIKEACKQVNKDISEVTIISKAISLKITIFLRQLIIIPVMETVKSRICR